MLSGIIATNRQRRIELGQSASVTPPPLEGLVRFAAQALKGRGRRMSAGARA